MLEWSTDEKSFVAVDFGRLVDAANGCRKWLGKVSRFGMGFTQSMQNVLRAVDEMNRIDAVWLQDFDEAMLGFFAIDHADAGMDERELSWYADLPAKDAALAYGEDFDLCRVDTFWRSSRMKRTV